MNTKTISLAVTAALLGGCASTDVQEATNKDYTASQTQINEATAKIESRAPIILPVSNVPYLGRTSVAAVKSDDLPKALQSTKKRKFDQNYVYDAESFGKMIAEETGLPVTVTAPPVVHGQVPKNIDLSPLPPMTVKEMLDVGASQLGVDWFWDESVLRLAPTITKIYEFDKSSGRTTGKMTLGKSSQSQIGTNGTNSGAQGNFTSELKGETNIEGDSWEDATSSLKAIAGPLNVIPNRSLSMFAVTCSKACHKQVKQFMDQANNFVTRQVHFAVMEVSVSATATGQSGVNWNVFYNKLGMGRQFLLNSPASLVDQTAAGSIGLKIIDTLSNGQSNTSPLRGSDAVFQALASAAKIVDAKPYDLMALNNETTTLGNTDQQSYTAATTVVPTGISGNPVYSQTPGYATYGQFIQVIPTVLSGGRVILRFGIDDTKLKSITPGANQGEIDKVLLGALNFNNQAVIRSGSTLVLSGFKRRSFKATNQGLLQGGKLGSESGNSEITETIIMITPTVTGS